LLVVAAGFLYVFFAVGHQRYGQLAHGLLPSISDSGALKLTVGIIGATVMPHVVYLHSALQKRRVEPASEAQRRTLLRFNKWDCAIGLGLAGIVNLAMLCIAAGLFHTPALSDISDLRDIHSQLNALVGGGAALAFGIALIASGISSSSVGTYAGQVVMAGFMGWRIPLGLRRAVTMLPAFVVIALSVNASEALVYSQIVLSFGIPFALVPLALITADRRLLREHTNRKTTTYLMVLVTVVITTLNAILLVDTLRSFV
jgi:manganese transport protein